MIRDMMEKDLEKVVEIEERTFSMPWSKNGFADALKMQANHYVVYEEEGIIKGYCGFYGVLDEGEITNVAVDCQYRNCGIAKAMLSELLKVAASEGITKMVLEVRVSNASAIHVYETLGFKNIGIRKGFYEKPVEDAMIMECILA